MLRMPRRAAMTAAALSVLLTAGITAARADITLTPVATDLPSPVGIDVRSGTNTMIVSVNLYVPGSPFPNPDLHNFENLAPGGTHSVIFPNVHGLVDEQKVTAVRCTSVGAWTAGDVFTGTGTPGEIIRIHSNGTFDRPWVTIPSPGADDVFRGGLHIDETGVWGGDMLAVTHGRRAFRITAAGGVTELPVTPAITPEAINTFPNDPGKFGFFAGKLVVGGEDDGKFYTLGPGDPAWSSAIDLGLNTKSSRFPSFAIEDLKLIRPNSNFYVCENTLSTVWKASAADLAPFVGDLIVVEEVPTRLWRLHWNGSTFTVNSLASVNISGGGTLYFEQGNFDEGDCGPPPGGPTRTWGFWKTHLDLFSAAVAQHCINLGVLQSAGCTENLTNPTLGTLEAIFWTSPGQNTSALGQARLQLAHQLIAAQANVCMLGTQPNPPTLISDAVAALDGTDTDLMNSLATLLDGYNNSGDPILLPPSLQGTKGDPKGSKGAATSTGCAFL